MKFTCPSDFNDPFDCIPEIDLNSIQEIPKRKPELIKAAAQQRGIPPEKIGEHIPEMLQRMEDAVTSGVWGKDMVSGVGICCLSRDPLNILMWSHYANDHKGFCLEFRISLYGEQHEVSNYLEWLVPHEVTYQEERPFLEIHDRSDNALDKQFLIKSKLWKYEAEERVIDHKRGPGIHSYDRSKILNSVIAGMKMENPELGQLNDAVEKMNQEIGLNVQLYQARAVKGRFALCVPDHPKLSVT